MCQRELDPNDLLLAPFCSKRCKMLDLGKWFAGDYRLPGRPLEPEEYDQLISDDDGSNE